jgi:Abnormal spindle-like microcephaly-assoc'd, ASPM-SPD-2-Hydin
MSNLRVVLIVCSAALPLFSGTIRVPADQPTIQGAITAAQNGDIVLVSPGTYVENIDFLGKAITVESEKGATATIINGGNVYSVVTFSSNEGPSSILSGFTIENGNALDTPESEGGGIAIENASPTIKDNIIQQNFGASAGGGIGVGFGSPLIEDNVIRSNSQSPQIDGGGGGGISLRGGGTAQIIGNVIENNTWNNVGAGFGGAIMLFGSGSTFIKNNIIRDNVAGTQGAAIWMVNDVSGTVIMQNLIVGNSSPDDAGIYWSNSPAALVNNTITDGSPITGTVTSLVVAEGVSPTVILANNLLISTKSTNAFYCVSGGIPMPANFYNNDVFSSKGSAYGGDCADQTGMNGNISKRPIFLSPTDFELKGGSVGIDAGNNKAPDLPSTDLAGNRRIINGNDGPTPVIDMGAYEFVPVILSPRALNFGSQAVSSTTSKTAVLTNSQHRSLTISSITVPTSYSVAGCPTNLAAFSSCELTVTFAPQATGSFRGSIKVIDNSGNSPQLLGLVGMAH